MNLLYENEIEEEKEGKKGEKEGKKGEKRIGKILEGYWKGIGKDLKNRHRAPGAGAHEKNNCRYEARGSCDYQGELGQISHIEKRLESSLVDFLEEF